MYCITIRPVASRQSPHFSRHLNDWEMGEVESLFRKLQPLAVRRDAEDFLSWRESRNGCFSVCSLYRSFTRASSDPFPWSIIWRSWDLVRVSFFAWEASWNRILTCDQLKRRGWNFPNRCYLCKEEEETSDHLFLVCIKARMLWNVILTLFGVHWVLHSSVKGNLLGLHRSFVGKRREKAWRAAPLCLMWTLWKERNGRAFNDVEQSNQDIKYSFLYNFMNWARVYIEDYTLFMIDFIDWLFVKRMTFLLLCYLVFWAFLCILRVYYFRHF